MVITSGDTMGKILTTLTITNRIDEANAIRGLISKDQIRSVTLHDVLVDTGATTLCLPPETIAQLGLDLLKEVDVTTAAGLRTARVFRMLRFPFVGEKAPLNVWSYPAIAIP